jgi:hypothetical protein
VRGKVDDCAAFVLVMTPEAESSTWVARELERAAAKDRPVLPLLLRGDLFTSLPMIQFERVADDQLPSRRFIEHLRTLAPSRRPVPTPTPAEPALGVPTLAAPTGSLSPTLVPVTGRGMASRRSRWLALGAIILLALNLVIVEFFGAQLDGGAFDVLVVRVDWAAPVIPAILLMIGARRLATYTYAVRAMLPLLVLVWLGWYVYVVVPEWLGDAPGWARVILFNLLPHLRCAGRVARRLPVASGRHPALGVADRSSFVGPMLRRSRSSRRSSWRRPSRAMPPSADGRPTAG